VPKNRRTLSPTATRKKRHAKLVRVDRLIALAEMVFGDKCRAWAWLEDNRQFDGTTPLEMCSTVARSRLVESRLHQLYFGIYA
jgi:hypothetical protein